MRRCARRLDLKLVAAFFLALAASVAQDPTVYLTPSVLRVGDKLACRCGGCRNTVGNCPMMHCSGYADPMRRRIFDMQSRGMTDAQIVNTIVREQGIVALASPPVSGLALITWIVPPLVLLIGFWIYSSYVRRHRMPLEQLSPEEQAVIDRYRNQIAKELDESSEK